MSPPTAMPTKAYTNASISASKHPPPPGALCALLRASASRAVGRGFPAPPLAAGASFPLRRFSRLSWRLQLGDTLHELGHEGVVPPALVGAGLSLLCEHPLEVAHPVL